LKIKRKKFKISKIEKKTLLYQEPCRCNRTHCLGIGHGQVVTIHRQKGRYCQIALKILKIEKNN